MTHAQQHDGHVALLAGMNGVGKPYMEVLPARALAPDVYELLGSPGLVLGCAQGDVIRRKPDGSFDVERRGPNLCVQAFRSVPFESASISELQRRFDALGGLVEAPGHEPLFVVSTVDARVGLPAVAEIMDPWIASIDESEWAYGNVLFNDAGEALEWWAKDPQ